MRAALLMMMAGTQLAKHVMPSDQSTMPGAFPGGLKLTQHMAQMPVQSQCAYRHVLEVQAQMRQLCDFSKLCMHVICLYPAL